jgi:hypothetical protein
VRVVRVIAWWRAARAWVVDLEVGLLELELELELGLGNWMNVRCRVIVVLWYWRERRVFWRARIGEPASVS